MYIKKIVGTTVDKLTLSYVEKHLKEALDQEYAIPTTVLAVVAEKSFNEYNMKSISHFLEKSFKTDYKDWKKFRNLLKIIEYLLKFGSNEFVLLAKQHQGDIRSLQNYSFNEGGSDKGAGIRESALFILTTLNNSRELELMREESRRHRERFTGISSNPKENSGGGGYGGGYSAPGGSNGGGGYSGSGGYRAGGGGYTEGSYSGSNVGENRGSRRNEGFLYSESQKKFAESVFGGRPEGSYQVPEVYNQSYGSKKNEREEIKYDTTNKSTYSAPDIFAVGSRPRTEIKEFPDADLLNTQKFVSRNNPHIEANLSRDPHASNNKVPDLFTPNEPKPAAPISSAPFNLSSNTANPVQNQVPDLFSNMKFPSSSKAPDLFQSTNTKASPTPYPDPKFDNKPQNPTSTDLFSLIQPTETPDLFSINYPKPSHTETAPNRPVDLFANVNRKDSKPSKNTELSSDIFGISSTEAKVQQNPNTTTRSVPANTDLFGFNEPTTYNPSNTGNLLNDLSISLTQPTPPSSMFTGMVQKRPSEPLQAPKHPTLTPGSGLEGLSLEMNPSPSPSYSMKPNPGVKVRTNLIQTEEKTQKDPVKKAFNPSEFEAKLFSLDFK